jgi:hypothetical protein
VCRPLARLLAQAYNGCGEIYWHVLTLWPSLPHRDRLGSTLKPRLLRGPRTSQSGDAMRTKSADNYSDKDISESPIKLMAKILIAAKDFEKNSPG